jgi:DNA-binding NarL/FixJ family response regulator
LGHVSETTSGEAQKTQPAHKVWIIMLRATSVDPVKLPQPIRVFLIDSHEVIRVGLRLLIESRPGLKVVGEAAGYTNAMAVGGKPDIILINHDLDGDGSLDFLPALLKAAQGASVILLTGTRDDREYHRAMRLGVMGVVNEAQSAETLFKAIEKVQAGEMWFDRSTISSAFDALLHANSRKLDDDEAKIATLTEREREVITLVGEGLKNKEIAMRLRISEATVRHHLSSVFDKLGVSDRIELMIYAFRHGLAKPPGPRR